MKLPSKSIFRTRIELQDTKKTLIEIYQASCKSRKPSSFMPSLFNRPNIIFNIRHACKLSSHLTSSHHGSFDLIQRRLKEGDPMDGVLCCFTESDLWISQNCTNSLRACSAALFWGLIEVKDPSIAVCARMNDCVWWIVHDALIWRIYRIRKMWIRVNTLADHHLVLL